MEFILGIISMYFIGGISFLVYEKQQAKQLITKTELEMKSISREVTEGKILVALKRYQLRRKYNLVNATWKEQLIIIIAWIYIINNYKRA